MTDKEEIIIDGKIIGCLCYVDRPLHRYDKGCLVQSQAFKEQQTEEKPILRCDEIKNCPIKENFKQLQCKEQEYEELRQYHNKCCEEFEKEKQNLIDRYNQFSKDFFIGKYCKKEYCDLLKAKEQECEGLEKQLENSEKWRIKAESLNENFELKNTRYHKALEEIEEYINNQGINHKWNMYIQRFRQKILDIISKAKDGKNEQF